MYGLYPVQLAAIGKAELELAKSHMLNSLRETPQKNEWTQGH